MTPLHVTNYNLLFEAEAGHMAQMRISITANFDAPPELVHTREQLLAMVHMGADWKEAGLSLLDIQRVEDLPMSIVVNN